MIIRDVETLNLLINLVIASAKMRRLKIHQHSGNVHKPRAQIHLLIGGNKGSFKSTILNEIAKKFKTRPYTEITEPALVGTINKTTMMPLKGASWLCRNSVMVLDEFEFTDKTGRPNRIVNKLLQLTEAEQYHKRQMGFASIEQTDKDGDLFFKVGKNGEIEVKTCFSLIVGTMDLLQFRNVKLKALQSRCLNVQWTPGFDVILNVMKGYNIFKYEDLRQNKKLHPEIKLKDYKIIVDYLIGKTKDTELVARTNEDCCRVFAILNKHDYKIYDLIINAKQ